MINKKLNVRCSQAIKCISIILAVVCCGIFGVCEKCIKSFPDDITVYGNENISYKYSITISPNNQSIKEIKANADMGENSQIKNLTLLNIIPIKEVNVHTVEKRFVVPCGNLFGIKFYTKGISVINCNNIELGFKTVNPGAECGLRSGDTILKINGKDMTSCEDMQSEITSSGGGSLNIECERQGEIFHTVITPVQSDGEYRVGLWIRDSCAGLGTMTFYDPETNKFAALGHGICDSDTGELLPLDSAEITQAKISTITKGTNGSPGIINGYFASDETSGRALLNNETGLYGILDNPTSYFEPIEIANIQDIRKGEAQILCTLDDGEPKYYSIEITGVNYDEKNKTKNLQIVATDNRLLEKTGGIVQGMSGSPILQNGKLVGAVTHVLITNSAKGYGIFAQNMFDEIDKKLN